VSIAKGIVRVHLEPRGLIISLGEKGVFDSGSDQIRAEGKTLLDELATLLVTVGNYIRVEGHTDNVPINTPQFPSNWELSGARASSVVRLFIDAGVAPGRMTATGLSDQRPVAGNDTPEGRQRNRRVAIVIAASNVDDVPVELR